MAMSQIATSPFLANRVTISDRHIQTTKICVISVISASLTISFRNQTLKIRVKLQPKPANLFLKITKPAFVPLFANFKLLAETFSDQSKLNKNIKMGV